MDAKRRLHSSGSSGEDKLGNSPCQSGAENNPLLDQSQDKQENMDTNELGSQDKGSERKETGSANNELRITSSTNSNQAEIHDVDVKRLKRVSKRKQVVDKRTAKERAQDERLAERQIRFNKMQIVKSLQDLCVNAVISHLDYFCSVVDPFSCLPGPILNLLENATEDRMFSIFDVVVRFTTERTEELRVQLCGRSYNRVATTWTRDNVDHVFDLICQKCENKLSLLSLKLCMKPNSYIDWIAPQPSFAQLHQVFHHQINLQNIDLGYCGINDDTLAVIGSTCEQLRTLQVGFNKDITDQGILYLCGNTTPFEKCLKITYLNVIGTSVSTNGIFNAILKLHLLEKLHCDDEIMCDAMVLISKCGATEELQLKKLKVDYDYYMEQNLDGICKMLPNVNKLTIFNEFLTHLTPFLQLDKVTKLTLTTSASSLQVSNLITHFGVNLTNLQVCDSHVSIDLSLIGQFCPNVELLSLHYLILSNCAYDELLPHSFKKLEYFAGFSSHADICLPDSIITRIMSSKYLKECRLNKIKLPEQILQTLLVEARENGEVFSALEMAEFANNTYSVETWMEFVSLAPNLICIAVEDASGDEFLQLRKFIQRNELSKSITIMRDN